MAAFSQLFVLVRKVVLDRSKHCLQVELLKSGLCFEGLSKYLHAEGRTLRVLRAEPLQELWEEHRSLISLQHAQQDLEGDILEVRLVCLDLLEEEVVAGE